MKFGKNSQSLAIKCQVFERKHILRVVLFEFDTGELEGYTYYPLSFLWVCFFIIWIIQTDYNEGKQIFIVIMLY